MPSLRVLVSGGGTGGHIFPAIAIANAIKAKRPDAEFLFVGALGKMEMEKVPAAGYRIEGLPITGIQRSLTLKNLVFPFKLMASMAKAKKLVRSFQPNVAIGTGGFASGPTLRAAISAGIPALIQEQNSFPGVTNRILGKKANSVCVAYDGMDQYFEKSKLIFTGNPVRQNMVQLNGKRDKALAHFKLNSSKPVVLVIGGSLGARSVNLAIEGGLAPLLEEGVQLIWQTGKPSFENAKEAAGRFPDADVRVHQFIPEMDLAYAAADVVVSRAGAIAVSELSLVKKPVILVPFPHAAEDHQTKNAMALVNKHAAIHIPDADANTDLVPRLIQLLNNKEEQETLIKNIQTLGIPDSAERIAEEALRIVNA